MAAARKLEKLETVIFDRDLMKNVCDFFSCRDRSCTYRVNTLFKDLDKEYDEREIKKLSTYEGIEISTAGIACERTAMLVLRTPALLEKLGCFNKESCENRHSPYENGKNLLDIGLAHACAANYIMENAAIKARLSDAQIEQLQDKLEEKPFKKESVCINNQYFNHFEY